MQRIRLAEYDRERLGAPEWMEVDFGRLTAREAGTIQRLSGYSLEELSAALRGSPVFKDGRPVYDVGPDGEPRKDDKGDLIQKRRYEWEAYVALVWIALKRSGIAVPYQDLDFDLSLEIDDVPDEPVEPEGKDSTPDSELTSS